MAKTDGVARIIALAALGKNGGSSTGGTTNYLELANKPKINNVELTGNKTLEDLGINIPDLENYYTKDIVNEALSKKQDTLIAGKNIIINGEVINAADDVIPTYILQTNIRPKYDESVEFTDVYDDLGKIINDNPGKTVHLCLYIPTNGIYITLAYYGTIVCPDIRTSTAISASYPSFMTMNQNKARIILSLELNIDKTVTPYKAVVKKFSCVEGPTEYAVTEDISNVENRTMEMVMMMLEDSNNNFLAKTNTTEFVPTGDYNPATKKYVDDSKNYVGEYKFIILDDIYSLSKEYFDSVLLPAVKSVGWEKVVVILSNSIGYSAMGFLATITSSTESATLGECTLKIENTTQHRVLLETSVIGESRTIEGVNTGDSIKMTFTCPENVYTPMEVTVSVAMYLTMETTSKVEDVIYSALMTEEFITDQKIDYLRTELEHAKAGQKPQIHTGTYPNLQLVLNAASDNSEWRIWQGSQGNCTLTIGFDTSEIGEESTFGCTVVFKTPHRSTATTAFSWDADYGDLVSIVGDDVVDGIFTPQLLKVYEMVFTWNGFVMNCVVKGSKYTAPQE